jgi:hypothetical protein
MRGRAVGFVEWSAMDGGVSLKHEVVSSLCHKTPKKESLDKKTI